MNTDTNERRKRDWSIIIFILPLGLAMMLCVGQMAVRMSPHWSVSGEMNSSLDPENAPKQNALIVPPISSDILTPMSWWDTFLTPSGGGVVFPPFITFEPSLTPTVTATPSGTPASPTASPTGVTGTPTPPTGTPTKKPTDDNTATATVALCLDPTANNYLGPAPCTFPTPALCLDPTADNYLGPAPCTFPTPALCLDPTADNYLGPAPCTFPTPALCLDPTADNYLGPAPCTFPTPPTNCTDPNATNNGGPLPCVFPVAISSTLVGSPTAVPTGITDPPNGNVAGTNVANIPDGYYVIITLSTPIVVVGISDTGYDLAYYERQLDNIAMPPNGGVQMDNVILSISTAVNGTYYQIFNWGDGTADTNSNLGDVVITTGTENDNQPIDASEFYGTYPQDTGVLIDVDNAPSHPPPGNYAYLAIQAPVAPPSNDGADVDAVEVVDIPFTP
jgi:hypothetical protein